MLSALKKIWRRVRGPFLMVCDPVTKVCKPALVRHWERKYKRYGYWSLASLFFDLALLSLLGMIVVGGIVALYVLPAVPKPGLVTLEVNVPSERTSGAPSAFSVSYKNETLSPLGCALLRVRLPTGFLTAKSDERKAKSDGCEGLPLEQAYLTESPGFVVRRLGDIPAAATGSELFDGTAYGRTDDRQGVHAELIYWDVGRSSPTRVAARAEWTLASSIAAVRVEPSESLVRGRAGVIDVQYAATGGTIDEMVIRLEAPEEFRVLASTPPVRGTYEWRVYDVGQIEERIRLSGVLSASGAAAPSAPVFTVRAFVVADGVERLVAEDRVNADARATGFELSQDLAVERVPVLAPGQEVAVKVSYKNGGTETLRGVRIALETETALLASVSPDGLAWEVGDLAPGESGELVASLRLRDAFPAEAVPEGGQPYLPVQAVASFTLADDPSRPVREETALETIPVSSRLALKASAFYFTADGEQLGVGPLPPRVGETTKYRIVVFVENTTADVEDAWFEAHLPPNVAWTGRYSVNAGESMDYLASTGRVRWRIGTVPAGSGEVGERVGASFEVALTPSDEDAGRAAVLASGLSVTGVDASTGVRLTAPAADVTTELEFDERAAGKEIIE